VFDDNGVPGAGRYDTTLPLSKGSSVHISVVKAPSLFDDNGVPGAGTYETTVALPKGPSAHISVARHPSLYDDNGVPGAGKYNTAVKLKKGPSAKISVVKRPTIFDDDMAKALPGPGSYDLTNSFNATRSRSPVSRWHLPGSGTMNRSRSVPLLRKSDRFSWQVKEGPGPAWSSNGVTPVLSKPRGLRIVIPSRPDRFNWLPGSASAGVPPSPHVKSIPKVRSTGSGRHSFDMAQFWNTETVAPFSEEQSSPDRNVTSPRRQSVQLWIGVAELDDSPSNIGAVDGENLHVM